MGLIASSLAFCVSLPGGSPSEFEQDRRRPRPSKGVPYLPLRLRGQKDCAKEEHPQVVLCSMVIAIRRGLKSVHGVAKYFALVGYPRLKNPVLSTEVFPLDHHLSPSWTRIDKFIRDVISPYTARRVRRNVGLRTIISMP